jgi:hypothetical protein
VEPMTRTVTRSCSSPLRGEWLERSALAPMREASRCYGTRPRARPTISTCFYGNRNRCQDAAEGHWPCAVEGVLRWWLGRLAVIKATGQQTSGRYPLAEVLEPEPRSGV